jgi:hypothetical protein
MSEALQQVAAIAIIGFTAYAFYRCFLEGQ